MVCICLCLGIPKIYKVSPHEVMPVVQISGLDFVQAWLSKRQALLHQSDGSHIASLLAWKDCISRHPFQTDNLRQATLSYLHVEQPTQLHVRDVIHYGRMMMKGGKGKPSNVLLSSLVLVWMGAMEEAFDAIQTVELPQHPDSLKVAASISLLSGRELPPQWIRALENLYNQGHSDANMILRYDRAFRTGDWNEVTSDSSAFDLKVDQGIGNKGLLKMLTMNLRYWTLFHCGSTTEMDSMITHLQSQNGARGWHWLLYWKKLLETGQGHRAWSQLNEGGAYEWINEDQVIEWGRLIQQLDPTVVLHQKMKPFLDRYPSSVRLHFYYARLLIHAERWSELRGHAFKIRARPALSKMEGLSLFMEAEACRRENDMQTAMENYRKWMAQPIHYPNLELQAVNEIRSAGLHGWVLRRYRALEPWFEHNCSFWEEALTFAVDMQWERYQLIASRKLFELNPQSSEFANDYASVLLAMRWDTTEVLALTDTLYQQNPHDQNIALNHIHALIQNNRSDEAALALSAIRPEELSDRNREVYDLAKFEWFCLTGNTHQACSLAPTLNPDKLFVHQKIWLEERLEEMACQ